VRYGNCHTDYRCEGRANISVTLLGTKFFRSTHCSFTVLGTFLSNVISYHQSLRRWLTHSF
jgi:hypothetical protein